MKKNKVIISVSALLLVSTIAFATTQKVSIIIDGVPLNNPNVKIENGKTLVPVREVSEALGAEVVWDNNTKTVNINSKKANTNDVEVIIGKSSKFSKEEISNAVISTKSSFNLPANLTNLSYNEYISNKYIESYLTEGADIKPENVIVLLSVFTVNDKINEDITDLIEGKEYTNYQWVLVREDSTSKWEIDAWGYKE